jgi:D-beta-D-heptose 7-phosphate kinase/D-beta-D-heptose 1-phosphate adenosyltransferase
VKVLVIGDACEDVYIYGDCNRLAPEAPVPVFVPQSKTTNGGMAMNVFANLKSLGTDCDIFHNVEEITKTRYVDKKTNHIFLRVDTDDKKLERVEEKHLDKDFLKQYDAIVISDYNKGFLTEEDIEKICYNHPLTFMDTKKNLGRWAKDCTWIKINEEEYNKTFNKIAHLGHIFDDKLIVTLSDKGCRYKGDIFPVEKVEIKDLSGAGDTFLASFVSDYLKNKNATQAIIFANECATQVVQKRGVNVI